MSFTVVEVPADSSSGNSAPVVAAMRENLGKAISLVLEGRDANTLRKTLRANLSSKGLLAQYNFRTRVSNDKKSMTVWLENKSEEDKAITTYDTNEK